MTLIGMVGTFIGSPFCEPPIIDDKSAELNILAVIVLSLLMVEAGEEAVVTAAAFVVVSSATVEAGVSIFSTHNSVNLTIEHSG